MLNSPIRAKKNEISEVWEEEDSERVEFDETIKNEVVGVNINKIKNLNRLSEKSTSKSNVHSHKHYPHRSVQYSPMRSKVNETISYFEAKSKLGERKGVSRDQLNKLKWEQIKLKKISMAAIEDKHSIENTYLELVNKEGILAADKEERGCFILKQEKSIARALKERQIMMERYKGKSNKLANSGRI